MMKKYELTDETITIHDVKLHRIRSLIDIVDSNGVPRVSRGSLGGFIESEKNLSHYGSCWIYDTARAYGESRVSGEARLSERASVFQNASIRDKAFVSGQAVVRGESMIYENALVHGRSVITDYGRVCGNASISGGAYVCAMALVRGAARIEGDARVGGSVLLNAGVISWGAYIMDKNDLITFTGLGSVGRTTTAYVNRNEEDNVIYVHCGCFYGDINEFFDAVTETYSKDNSTRHERCKTDYYTAILMMDGHFKNSELKPEHRIDILSWLYRNLNKKET